MHHLILTKQVKLGGWSHKQAFLKIVSNILAAPLTFLFNRGKILPEN
jgi:hypothetical protein